MTVFKPVWARECEKALIDRGMTKRELARALKSGYSFLCSVMSGYAACDRLASDICRYLGAEK